MKSSKWDRINLAAVAVSLSSMAIAAVVLKSLPPAENKNSITTESVRYRAESFGYDMAAADFYSARSSADIRIKDTESYERMDILAKGSRNRADVTETEFRNECKNTEYQSLFYHVADSVYNEKIQANLNGLKEQCLAHNDTTYLHNVRSALYKTR